MNPRTNKIIQDAIKEIENDPNRFENNYYWIGFKKTLKEIEQAVADKNPLVKEYINIHREAEKDPNSTIGRMAREMRKALLYNEVYRKTVGNADFASQKDELKKELEGYTEAPAFDKYRLYLEGLKYLAGMTNEVSPEVESFFKKELSVPLQKKDSEYEKYRVGVEEYKKQENDRLDKLQAEIETRLPEIEKRRQELLEEERKAGTLNDDLFKLLNEENSLKKERSELELAKADHVKKENDLKKLKEETSKKIKEIAGKEAALKQKREKLGPASKEVVQEEESLRQKREEFTKEEEKLKKKKVIPEADSKALAAKAEELAKAEENLKQKKENLSPDAKALAEEAEEFAKERENFEKDITDREKANKALYSELNDKTRSLYSKIAINKSKIDSLTEKYGSDEMKALTEERKSLNSKLLGIPTRKEGLNRSFSPEFQKKVEVYHNAVAKIKARDLYSKQAAYSYILQEAFLGDDMKRKDGAGAKIFGGRETPAATCVGMMLLDGHKLEDIMNPTALLKEKKEIGQKYIKNRQEGNVAWYVKTMYDGSVAMMNAFRKYVKDHKNELKTGHDLAMHAGTLGILSHLCFDMYQELSNCRVVDDGKLYKTQDEYKKIQNVIGNFSAGSGLGGKESIKYEAYDIMNLSADTIAIEMTRQVGIKMLLDEIQKENPDFEAATIHSGHAGYVQTQMMLLPEIKQLQDEYNNIETESLSDEDIKKIGSMLDSTLINKRNIRFDKVKHPTKATVDATTSMGVIEKGQEMEVIVSRSGRQMIATDVPVRVDDHFKRLESKKFRGKESKNSIEFNKMMEEYDKACGKLNYDKADKDNLEALKDLKEAARAYIIAKRNQKGYTSEKMLDDKVDLVMMGKEKGGRSIFTTQGKDRYEFAVKVMANIFNIEKHYKEPEMQMENTEIKNPENTEIKQPENTEIKIPEQEINEIQDNGFGEL